MSFLGLEHDWVSSFRSYVHENDGVSNQIAFDKLIQGSVSGEARSMIYFQQINFALGIDHKVESQDLEAHVIGQIIGLGHPVFML